MEGTFFTGDFKRTVRFLFNQETLFVGESESYVKKGSGNGQLSPLGPRWGTWREGSFTGDFERE